MSNDRIKANSVAASFVRHPSVVLIGGLLLVMVCPALAQADVPAGFNVTQKDYPQADAVILLLERDYKLEKDRSIRYHEHKWIKMFHKRVYRTLGDPRIDYQTGTDDMKIITAQTHLPDGTKVPVPDYSFNRVGADDVAGWPIYADWEQMVVSLSGLMPGAVSELEHVKVTRPGVERYLAADLRLPDVYPVVEHKITITVPTGQQLFHQVTNVPAANMDFSQEKSGDYVTYTYVFKNLPASLHEAQTPPWRAYDGRLRFTTCPSASEWTSALCSAIDAAAKTGDAINTLAAEIADQQAGDTDKARAVAATLRETFNVVTSQKAWRDYKLRPATEVLQSGFGSTMEAAALLLATCRSVGLSAEPRVAVDGETFDDAVPVDSNVVSFIVEVSTADGPLFIDPQRGPTSTIGGWETCVALSVDKDGRLARSALTGRAGAPTQLDAVADIKVADDGTAKGSLSVRLTGLMFTPNDLLTTDDQKKRITGILDGVLKGFGVDDFVVASLSETEFRAEAKISSAEPLKTVGKMHVVALGDQPPFLAGAPVPLDTITRHTPVRLAGPVREKIIILLELPDKWKVEVTPASLAQVQGDWGSAEQTVQATEKGWRLARSIELRKCDLSPEDYDRVRRVINTLRTDGHRTWLIGKPEPN